MNILKQQVELREVVDAMYDSAEYQDDYAGTPFAIGDIVNEQYLRKIREFVPLYTVVGEDTPQLRKESITWGSDRNEGLTFLDKFYDENKSILPKISDESARHVTELFLAGKQWHIESSNERAPKGTIDILGMIAVYTYTTFGHSFVDAYTEECSPVENVSAMFIVPRAFIRSVEDTISNFTKDTQIPIIRKSDWLWAEDDLTNASEQELTIMGAFSHVLAPDPISHPSIKKLF